MFSPDDGSTATFQVTETGTQSFLSGEVHQFSLLTGAHRFSALPVLSIPETVFSSESLSLPIDIDAPSVRGTFEGDVQGIRAALTARMDTFKLKGLLRLDLHAPGKSLLEVKQGGLEFSAGLMATSQRIIYGGTPQFIGAGILFRAATDLSISQFGSKGKLWFRPDLVTILDPRLQLATGTPPIIVHAPARFSTSTVFTVDLHTGQLYPEEGVLEVGPSSAEPEPGQPIVIGNIRADGASLSFTKLMAIFAGGTGMIDLRGLQIKATSFATETTGGFSSSDQTSWSGKSDDLLRVRRIVGRLVSNEDGKEGIEISDLAIEGITIRVQDVEFGKGTALRVSAKSLAFSAEFYSSSWIKESTFDVRGGFVRAEDSDTAMTVGLARLLVQADGGSPSKPNGTGSIVLSPVRATLNSPIELKMSCRGQPDFQKVPAKAGVSALGVVFPFALTGGVIQGSGVAFPLTVTLRGNGRYDCRGTLIDLELIPASRWRFEYQCMGTLTDPWRTCEAWGETPAVKVTIDWIYIIDDLLWTGTASLATLEVGPNDDGKTVFKVCLGQLRGSPASINASLTLQPRTPSEMFDRVSQGLMIEIGRPFGTTLTSVLATVFTQMKQWETWIKPFEVCK